MADMFQYSATPAARVDGSRTMAQVDPSGRILTSQGAGLYVSTTVTRPANTTAYTANDVIGASAAAMTFAIGAVSGSSIKIQGVSLMREAAAVIASEGAYTLHLYNVTPPSALADNAAFDLPSGDRDAYLGNIAITIPIDLGATLWVEINNINKVVRLAGTSLFGYLVTAGGYTPASAAVHRVAIHAEQL